MRTIIILTLAIGAATTVTAAAAEPPAISTVTVSELRAREVVVNASVDPRGAATATRLEFGPTAALGARSGPVGTGAGSEPILVTITIKSLRPRTTYHYRFTATNEAGTTVSEILTFTTPRGSQPVVPVPQLSFAISIARSPSPLGHLLAVTRPRNLAVGSTLTIRCVRACTGSRRLLVTAANQDARAPLRFTPQVRITRRSVLEIRVVRPGYVGRLRRYRFRRSDNLVVTERLLERCLTAETPRRVIRCSAG